MRPASSITSRAPTTAELRAGAEAVLRDAEHEPLLRPNEAKRLLGNIDVGAVFRKFLKVKIVGARRVSLEYAIVSSGRVTTRSAINRYHRRLNGLDASGPSPADLDRQHHEAERRLEAAGL